MSARLAVSENGFSRLSIIVWVAIGTFILFSMKQGSDRVEWGPAIICAVLVFAYMVTILIFFKGESRNRLADNCYYLGLIYTLISLVIVLHQQQEGTSVELVLSAFGVALATTIAGIVARLFLQERAVTEVEAQEYLRSARTTASEAVIRLAEETTILVDAFSDARKQLQETAKDASASMERLAASLQGGLGRVVGATAAAEDALAGLGGAAAKARTGLSALGQIDPARIQEMLTQCDQLANATRAAAAAIEERGITLSEELRKLLQSTDGMLDGMTGAADATRKSVMGLGEAAVAARDGLQALKGLDPAQAQEVLNAYQQLAEVTKGVALAIEQQGGGLAKELGNLHKSTETLVQNMDNVSDDAKIRKLQSRVENLSNTINDATKSLSDLARTASNAHQELQQHRFRENEKTDPSRNGWFSRIFGRK